MCGISFILDKKGILDEKPIVKMMASLNHRGPDSSSYFIHSHNSSQYFFAANRLKIVEKSDIATQPFFSHDKSKILLFNGEIYNFFDLKNLLLQKGITFKSNSDTEVLLHWIGVFGESGIEKLNGMFAFLYFDLQKNQLIAGRDRFGMKPLYFYNDERFLIISSEIKGIFSTSLVEKELNQKQIPHYLAFRHVAAPETFFRQVFQVQKGHLLHLAESKTPVIRPFISKQTQTTLSHPEPLLFLDKLKDSLLSHLHADFGVGLLFSGGIDSSLILSIAYQEGIIIPAFSIFTKENKEEAKIARSFARHKRIAHDMIEVDESLLDNFEEYVHLLDQPIADSAGLLTYKICRHASASVKVLLSGAGADELFAGYNRHQAFLYYLKNPKTSLFLKKNIWPWLKYLMPGNQSITSFLNNLDENKKVTFYNFVTSHFQALRTNFDSLGKDISAKESDYLLWSLEYDRNNYLPEDVLLISDNMSMQAGVEMRMPFLDNHLLDAINSTEASYLLKNGRKWILKNMLADFVPPSYLKQKKRGFGLPLAQWLRSPQNNHLWKLFETKNSIIFNFLNKEFFDNLITSHQTQKSHHEQELWSILVLAYWLEKEFG